MNFTPDSRYDQANIEAVSTAALVAYLDFARYQGWRSADERVDKPLWREAERRVEVELEARLKRGAV